MVGARGAGVQPSSSLLPPRRSVLQRKFVALVLAGCAVLALAFVAVQQWAPDQVALLQIANIKRDEAGIFDGAPDLVKRTLALSGGSHSALADDLSSANQRAKEAATTEYDATLDAYERREEGLRPRSTEDFRKHEDDAVVQRHFGLSGKDSSSKIAQELRSLDPLVVHQMAEDMEHPPKQELRMEAAQKRADHTALPNGEVKRLREKVKKLEHLNAELAVGGSAKAPSKAAAQAHAAHRAQAVAAKGVKRAEKRAIELTRTLVQPGGSAAMLRAEQVAEAGAHAETKKMGKETRAMLAGAGKYRMPKLPNIKTDSWGGVVSASSKSTRDSSKIPGVKEDTWPFAPGSFADKKQKPLPGLNEDSWSVFDIDAGAKRRKGRGGAAKKTVAGGCYPDKRGKLHCYGEKDLKLGKALEKALGMKDARKKPVLAPGTSLDALVPHIREDAEQQHLNAAAAAFAEMKEPLARTQQLLQLQTKGRKQSLERVNGQCSTLLDCMAGTGGMVPHHTHPSLGYRYDRQVSAPAQSVSRNALADDFRTGLHPWRLLGTRLPEAGDRLEPAGRSERYVAHTSRPSVRTPGHAAYDVAADSPSSVGVSQYARGPRQAEMLAESATEHTPLCDEGGVNCDSGGFPLGRVVDAQDERVEAGELPAGGMSAPWTPYMFAGNKPTDYQPGNSYEPPLEAMARGRRQPRWQQLELPPVKWGAEEEGDELTPEEAAEAMEAEREMEEAAEREREAAIAEAEQERAEAAAREDAEGNDQGVEAEMEEEEEREMEGEEGEEGEEQGEGGEEGEEQGEEQGTEGEERGEEGVGERESAEEEAAAAAAREEEEREAAERGEEEEAAEKEEAEAEGEEEGAEGEEKGAERGEEGAEGEEERGGEGAGEGAGRHFAVEAAGVEGPMHYGGDHGLREAAPEHFHLPGVKVSSGWTPYGYTQVWGVDRREGAKQQQGPNPRPCYGEECDHAGLPSASAYLKDWTLMDSIEHSDGKRGINSVKHAYESLAGKGAWPLEEEKEAEEKAAAEEEEEATHAAAEEAAKDQQAESEQEEEAGATANAAAQDTAEGEEKEGAGEEEEKEADSEEEEGEEPAGQAEEKEGAEAAEGGARAEEAAALGDERRAKAEGRWLRSYLHRVDAGAVAASSRGALRQSLAGVEAGGAGRQADLEKVEQAAEGLVAAGGREGAGVEAVAKAALQDASRDLHQRRVKRALATKVAKVDGGAQQLWQAKLAAMNKLTADVDKVTTADDVSDMSGVDSKLHLMVRHLQAQMAKEKAEDEKATA